MTIEKVGQQLSGQQLYECQKRLLASGKVKPGPSVVAVNLQLAENIGGVLRIADAAGCGQVVFVNAVTEDANKIRKIARNCDEHVAWQSMSFEEFVEYSKQLQPLIALELTTNSTNIFAQSLPDTCSIVIGGERYGLPEEILALCEYSLHIPMYGLNGSMNVTHALAVALFEWRHQYG